MPTNLFTADDAALKAQEAAAAKEMFNVPPTEAPPAATPAPAATDTTPAGDVPAVTEPPAAAPTETLPAEPPAGADLPPTEPPTPAQAPDYEARYKSLKGKYDSELAAERAERQVLAARAARAEAAIAELQRQPPTTQAAQPPAPDSDDAAEQAALQALEPLGDDAVQAFKQLADIRARRMAKGLTDKVATIGQHMAKTAEESFYARTWGANPAFAALREHPAFGPWLDAKPAFGPTPRAVYEAAAQAGNADEARAVLEAGLVATKGNAAAPAARAPNAAKFAVPTGSAGPVPPTRAAPAPTYTADQYNALEKRLRTDVNMKADERTRLESELYLALTENRVRG